MYVKLIFNIIKAYLLTMLTISNREKKQEDDFEIEKTSLQNTLDTTQLLLDQKERDVDKIQKEVRKPAPRISF